LGIKRGREDRALRVGRERDGKLTFFGSVFGGEGL
jgi:hypothetical protein